MFLIQGFGVTEGEELPDVLLETTVITQSNDECLKWIYDNVTNSRSETIQKIIEKSFPEGITDVILCTYGIQNNETKCYSVISIISI